MHIDEAEKRVLDFIAAFESVSGRESIRHDRADLREAFDRLVEKGLIKTVYVLSESGRAALPD